MKFSCSILFACLILSGCAPGEFSYPYLRTEGLLAACNGDILENEKTKHVADVICKSYLNAVLDSLEAQRYHVMVPSVCMPDSETLLEQAAEAAIALDEKRELTPENKAEAMKEIREGTTKSGGTLPRLHDVLVLYRGYVMEEPIYGWAYSDDHWSIALHRTPFETVAAALHEAWPCEFYNADSDGYHVIYQILKGYDLLYQ